MLNNSINGNVSSLDTAVLAIAQAGSTIDASQLPANVAVTEVAVGPGATLIGGAGPTRCWQGDSSNNMLIGGTGSTTMMYANLASDTLSWASAAACATNLLHRRAACGIHGINVHRQGTYCTGTVNTLNLTQFSANVSLNLTQMGTAN